MHQNTNLNSFVEITKLHLVLTEHPQWLDTLIASKYIFNASVSVLFD